MTLLRPTRVRTRLTLWYTAVLAGILLLYAAAALVFQYTQLQRQLYHDEAQDMITVEGLLHFTPEHCLELRQDYIVRPQNRLLTDRYMEVFDVSGRTLYRSTTLHGQRFGGPIFQSEGENSFDERTTRLLDGKRVFTISHVHPMDGTAVLIRLGFALSPLTARLQRFLYALLFAFPVALGAASLLGRSIADRALKPLDAMASRAEGVTANNLSERLEVADPQDEFGHMARVLNQLFERLENAFDELHRFTANAAHELRTPLVGLRVVGESAMERSEDIAELKDAIGGMLEKAAQLTQTIDSLLLLARTEARQTAYSVESFDLRDLFAEARDTLDVMLDERAIHLEIQDDGSTSHTVCADRDLVRIAVLNVLHNAIKFSPDASIITVGYASRNAKGQALERLTIHDAGPGLSPQDRLRVTERFYTAHSSEHGRNTGTGLGLSIAKTAVQRCGGTITFDADTLCGTVCHIDLPAAGNPASVLPS